MRLRKRKHERLLPWHTETIRFPTDDDHVIYEIQGEPYKRVAVSYIPAGNVTMGFVTLEEYKRDFLIDLGPGESASFGVAFTEGGP